MAQSGNAMCYRFMHKDEEVFVLTFQYSQILWESSGPIPGNKMPSYKQLLEEKNVYKRFCRNNGL